MPLVTKLFFSLGLSSIVRVILRNFGGSPLSLCPSFIYPEVSVNAVSVFEMKQDFCIEQ